METPCPSKSDCGGRCLGLAGVSQQTGLARPIFHIGGVDCLGNFGQHCGIGLGHLFPRGDPGLIEPTLIDLADAFDFGQVVLQVANRDHNAAPFGHNRDRLVHQIAGVFDDLVGHLNGRVNRGVHRVDGSIDRVRGNGGDFSYGGIRLGNGAINRGPNIWEIGRQRGCAMPQPEPLALALHRPLLQRARRHPSFVAGALLSALLGAAALLSLLWSPYPPAAINIPNKLAAPGAHVVCVAGDGGFAHTWAELEMLRRMNLDITVLVLNNQILGYQKDAEDSIFGAHTDACYFAEVDHAMIARACGCEGLAVASARELGAALDAAFASAGPTLIDIRTDPAARPPITAFEGKFKAR